MQTVSSLGKNKKNMNLLSAKLAQRVIKVPSAEQKIEADDILNFLNLILQRK